MNDLDDIDRVCDILFLRDDFLSTDSGHDQGSVSWKTRQTRKLAHYGFISKGFRRALLGIRSDELKGAASRGFNHKQKYCCNARTKISSEFYQRGLTIANFLRILAYVASKIEKNGQVFQISIHFHPCHP